MTSQRAYHIEIGCGWHVTCEPTDIVIITRHHKMAATSSNCQNALTAATPSGRMSRGAVEISLFLYVVSHVTWPTVGSTKRSRGLRKYDDSPLVKKIEITDCGRHLARCGATSGLRIQVVVQGRCHFRLTDRRFRCLQGALHVIATCRFTVSSAFY